MTTAGSVPVLCLDGTLRSFRSFVSWVFVRLHPNEFEADPKDPFKHDKLALRISVGSDGGEEVPVGFPGVEKGADSVVREVAVTRTLLV